MSTLELLGISLLSLGFFPAYIEGDTHYLGKSSIRPTFKFTSYPVLSQFPHIGLPSQV